MSTEKDELAAAAQAGQDALANIARYTNDKADVERALDSFELSKYKDASIDIAKWKTLRSNPEVAIYESVNITLSAFNFFKRACNTSISMPQLTEIIQQSWSTCEELGLMRDSSFKDCDYLYFPLVALIPDDGHSFCEVSIGISREGGLPFFCGRIFIPEEWHKNGFSLSNIEVVNPKQIGANASKQQADTQLKRLTNTREDKKRVEGILRKHLERGMWYHLPDVGQTLKRYGGYDSKGLLRGFLANCDFLEMSEPDPKSGQPNVRIKTETLSEIESVAGPNNYGAEDSSFIINRAPGQSASEFLSSDALGNALRAPRLDEEAWDLAIEAVCELLPDQIADRCRTTKPFVLSLLASKSNASLILPIEDISRLFEYNREQAQELYKLARSSRPMKQRPDELAKSLEKLLGVSAQEVECICRLGILTNFDKGNCVYRLMNCLAMREDDEQTLLDACQQYSEEIAELNSAGLNNLIKTAWTLVSAQRFHLAHSYLKAIDASLKGINANMEVMAPILRIASVLVDKTTGPISIEECMACKGYLKDTTLLRGLLGGETLDETSKANLAYAMLCDAHGEDRRSLLHVLRNALTDADLIAVGEAMRKLQPGNESLDCARALLQLAQRVSGDDDNSLHEAPAAEAVIDDVIQFINCGEYGSALEVMQTLGTGSISDTTWAAIGALVSMQAGGLELDPIISVIANPDKSKRVASAIIDAFIAETALEAIARPLMYSGYIGDIANLDTLTNFIEAKYLLTTPEGRPIGFAKYYPLEAFFAIARFSASKREVVGLYCSYAARYAAAGPFERFCAALAYDAPNTRSILANQFYLAFEECGGDARNFIRLCRSIITAIKRATKLKGLSVDEAITQRGDKKISLNSAIYAFLDDPENEHALIIMSSSADIFNEQVAWCAELVVASQHSQGQRRLYCLGNLEKRMRKPSSSYIVEYHLSSLAVFFERDAQDLFDLAPEAVRPFLVALIDLLTRNAQKLSSDNRMQGQAIARLAESAKNLTVPNTARAALLELKSILANLLLCWPDVLSDVQKLEAILSSGDALKIATAYYERLAAIGFDSVDDEQASTLYDRALTIAKSQERDEIVTLLKWIDDLAHETSKIAVEASCCMIEFGLRIRKSIDIRATLDDVEMAADGGWVYTRVLIEKYLMSFPDGNMLPILGGYVEDRFNRRDLILTDDDFRLVRIIHELRRNASNALMHKLSSNLVCSTASELSGTAFNEEITTPVASFYRAYGGSCAGAYLTYAFTCQYWKIAVGAILGKGTQDGERQECDTEITELCKTRDFKNSYSINPYELNRRIVKDYGLGTESDKQTLMELATHLSTGQRPDDASNIVVLLELFEIESANERYRRFVADLVDAGKQIKEQSRRFIVQIINARTWLNESQLELAVGIMSCTYHPLYIIAEFQEMFLNEEEADSVAALNTYIAISASNRFPEMARIYLDALSSCLPNSTKNTASDRKAASDRLSMSVNSFPAILQPFCKVLIAASSDSEFVRPLRRITGEVVGLASTTNSILPGTANRGEEDDDAIGYRFSATPLDGLIERTVYNWNRLVKKGCFKAQETTEGVTDSSDARKALTTDQALRMAISEQMPSDREGQERFAEELITIIATEPEREDKPKIAFAVCKIVINSLLLQSRWQSFGVENLPACDDILEAIAMMSLESDAQDNGLKLTVLEILDEKRGYCVECVDAISEILLLAIRESVRLKVVDEQNVAVRMVELRNCIKGIEEYLDGSAVTNLMKDCNENAAAHWFAVARITSKLGSEAITELLHDLECGSLERARVTLNKLKPILNTASVGSEIDDALEWCEKQALIKVELETEGGFDGNVYFVARNDGARPGAVSVNSVEVTCHYKDEKPARKVSAESIGSTNTDIQPNAIDGFMFATRMEDFDAISSVDIKAIVSDCAARHWTVAGTMETSEGQRVLGNDTFEYDAQILDSIDDWPALVMRRAEKHDFCRCRDNRRSPVLIFGSKGVGKTAFAKGVEKERRNQYTIPIFLTCTTSRLSDLLIGEDGLFDKLAGELCSRFDLEYGDSVIDCLDQLAGDRAGLHADQNGLSTFLDEQRKAIDNCLNELWMLTDAKLRINVYIDESQRLFVDEGAIEERFDEIRNALLGRIFNSSKRRGLFFWTFIGCKNFVRLASENGGNEQFKAQFKQRIQIRRFSDDSSRLAAIRGMLGIEEDVLHDDHPVLGNLTFTRSALYAIDLYTAGHARPIKRIASGITDMAYDGIGAFASRCKRFVCAADVIFYLRDSVESDMGAQWVKAEQMMSEDLGELDNGELEKRLLDKMALHLAEWQIPSIPKSDIPNLLNEILEGEGVSAAYDPFPVLEDRGIIISVRNRYAFTSELYRRCCERSASKKYFGSASANAFSSLQDLVDQLKGKIAEKDETIEDLTIKWNAAEKKASDAESARKQAERDHDSAVKEAGDRVTVQGGAYIHGNVNIDVDIQNIQNNIQAVFGDNNSPDRFSSLFGNRIAELLLEPIDTKTLNDDPNGKRLLQAKESIKLLASERGQVPAELVADSAIIDDPIQVDADTSARNLDWEIDEARFSLLDLTLEKSMRYSVAQSLSDIEKWLRDNEQILLALDINSETNSFLAYACELGTIDAGEISIQGNGRFDQLLVRSFVDSVLKVCQGFMRSVHVFALFKATNDSDFAAAATPACRAFEGLWKGLMLKAMTHNQLTRYMFSIDENGKPKPSCSLVSHEKLTEQIKNRYNLGGIAHLLRTVVPASDFAYRLDDYYLKYDTYSSYGREKDAFREILVRLSDIAATAVPRGRIQVGNRMILAEAARLQAQDVYNYVHEFSEFTDKRNASQHGTEEIPDFGEAAYRDLLRRLVCGAIDECAEEDHRELRHGLYRDTLTLAINLLGVAY